MKISKLITALNKIKNEEGNLPIYIEIRDDSNWNDERELDTSDIMVVSPEASFPKRISLYWDQ